MRIGIELGQLFPRRSGGIVTLLQGVCGQLFRIASNDQFFIYRGAENVHLADLVDVLPPHVTAVTLDGEKFWEELAHAAVRDQLDVLFRSYPIEHPVGFPMERQIVLVPDLQHEFLPECFTAEFLARRRAAFAPLIRGAGAVAVLAEHGRTILRERYPDAHGEVFLLPPASSLSGTEATERRLSPEIEAALPAVPFFLFPANLWPHKNHRRLFEALARLRAVRPDPVGLVLVGEPTGWPELEPHCQGLSVCHLGFVGPATLAALYRRCLAVTYFSLYEGFGIPLLEAFQFGAPVLCSNTTSLPEIGGDAVLSCDPTDVAAMTVLLARVADDSGLRADLVRRGHAREGLYTWEKSARGLLDACRRVATHPLKPDSVMDALTVVCERSAFYRGVCEERLAEIATLSEAANSRAKVITHLHEQVIPHFEAVIAELRGQVADLLATNGALHARVAEQHQQIECLTANLREALGHLGEARQTINGAWSCLPHRLVRKTRRLLDTPK